MNLLQHIILRFINHFSLQGLLEIHIPSISVLLTNLSWLHKEVCKNATGVPYLFTSEWIPALSSGLHPLSTIKGIYLFIYFDNLPCTSVWIHPSLACSSPNTFSITDYIPVILAWWLKLVAILRITVLFGFREIFAQSCHSAFFLSSTFQICGPCSGPEYFFPEIWAGDLGQEVLWLGVHISLLSSSLSAYSESCSKFCWQPKLWCSFTDNAGILLKCLAYYPHGVCSLLSPFAIKERKAIWLQ